MSMTLRRTLESICAEVESKVDNGTEVDPVEVLKPRDVVHDEQSWEVLNRYVSDCEHFAKQGRAPRTFFQKVKDVAGTEINFMRILRGGAYGMLIGSIFSPEMSAMGGVAGAYMVQYDESQVRQSNLIPVVTDALLGASLGNILDVLLLHTKMPIFSTAFGAVGMWMGYKRARFTAYARMSDEQRILYRNEVREREMGHVIGNAMKKLESIRYSLA